MIGIITENTAFVTIVQVYESLFQGGMMIIIYETSAELAFPVGESMSIGFIHAIFYAIR